MESDPVTIMTQFRCCVVLLVGGGHNDATRQPQTFLYLTNEIYCIYHLLPKGSKLKGCCPQSQSPSPETREAVQIGIAGDNNDSDHEQQYDDSHPIYI